MEYPAPQTGSDIEGANSAWATKAADDQKILIGDARGVKADARRPLYIQASTKMNGTILPEASDRLAGFRIERVEMIANTGEESLFAAGFILPEYQTALPGGSASGSFGLRIPFPEFPTGGGVEGDDLAGGRGGVKHAGDNQIVGLVFAFVAGVVGPGDFQLADIAPVDLLERRVKASPFIAEIGWPIDVGRRRYAGRAEDGQRGR